MLLDQAIMADVDYYEILGLSPEATVLDIEAAFKDKSSGLNLRHPDEKERVAAAEQMLTLTQAYETLSDAMLRSQYDKHLLGRPQNPPIKDQVDLLFKEGIRAYRQHQTDTALRLLKEVTRLYPHRPLYRVHLAIAYADKQWQSFTESELETALRLDPDYRFAKETIAKLLFKLPDKRNYWYKKKLNQQVVGLASMLVLSGTLIATGVPQGLISGLYQKIKSSTVAQPKKVEDQALDQLPEDLRKELIKKEGVTDERFEIPFKDPGWKPAGNIYDYSKLTAKTKVFYPEQKMVVLTYEDGSILTYRPQDLMGWKIVAGTPIMITNNKELIPSPNSMPLKHPDMTDVALDDSAFPWWMFPEYDNDPGSNTTSKGSSPMPSNQNTKTPPANNQSTTSTPSHATTSNTTEPSSKKPEYNPYGGSR